MSLDQGTEDPVALLADVSNALRTLPGARALYMFGSLADGRGDRYSDLDLILVTKHLHSSLSSRLHVLSQVKPVALDWMIDRTPDSRAFTVLFADTSPCHKVDIDISVEGRITRETTTEFVQLWEEGGAQPMPPPPPLAGLLYAPKPDTTAHFVVGHVLGATRYVKARKRGNEFTCWRFGSALIEATHSLLYMREFPGELVNRKLTTSEYLRLDRAVALTQERFFNKLRFPTAENMDTVVYKAISELLTLSDDLITQSSLPASLITQFMTFFDAELLPPQS